MMRKLKTKLMCQAVALCCATLFMQSVAMATAPRSSGADYEIKSSTRIRFLDASTTSGAWLSTSRLRDASSSDKYTFSFVRSDSLNDVEVTSNTSYSNQTDGTLSLPQTETGSTETYVGSMRDLWAGSNDGELIHLTNSTITQSGSGIALITAQTPLPGAVWLGLLGLGAIGITRHRKQPV